MYTILLTQDNEFVTTVKERIMQRSKLVDSFRILVDQKYNNFNMAEFTVMMEYLTPVGREYKSEILILSDELYQDKLVYTVPFDTCLTREAGDIEIQLTFIKTELDENGISKQLVRKTSPTTIKIIPISAWSDIIADSALTAIDQRLIQVDAMINAMNDMSQALCDTKADNIKRSENGEYIQLTANGNPIGDKIYLNTSTCGACVQYVKVNDDGKLVVIYSDGSTEELATVGGAAGIYIPSISKDGILTMTLSQEVGAPSYSWDIDPSNNWNDIDSSGTASNYVWNEL